MMNMDEIIREAEKDPMMNRMAKELANYFIKEKACKVVNIEMEDEFATKLLLEASEKYIEHIEDMKDMDLSIIYAEFASLFGNSSVFRFTESGCPIEYIGFNAGNLSLVIIGNHGFGDLVPEDDDMHHLLTCNWINDKVKLDNNVVGVLDGRGLTVPDFYLNILNTQGAYYYGKVVLAMRYILEKYKKQQKVTANPSNIEIPDVKFIYPSDGNVPFQNNVIKFVEGGTA